MKHKYRLSIVALVLGSLILFLFLPQNRYILPALTHLKPNIEDYRIFPTRVVEAGNPHPWLIDSAYNRAPSPLLLEQSVAEYGTVAFLVIKDRKILFEKYWEDYGVDSYSNSFSMAKSIVSLMSGILIDRGVIPHIDMPVSYYLPELNQEGQSPLTIRHLLTMSAGIEWEESSTSLFSPNTKAYYGNNIEGLLRQVRIIEQPGVRFNYQSGVTQLLAMVLESATGIALSDIASELLWNPIQAENDALWSLDSKQGKELAYCCFNSNARDFARFGQLLLNGGVWDDKEVVSTQYLKMATAPADTLRSQYGEFPNTSYGAQFWCLDFEGVPVTYLRGILGQYVLVVPAWSAVIVRLGHKRSAELTSQFYPKDIDIWLGAAREIMNASDRNP